MAIIHHSRILTPLLLFIFFLFPMVKAASQNSPDEAGFADFLPSSEELEVRYSSMFKKCILGSGGVTATLRECLATEYKRLDGDLNKSYVAAIIRVRRQETKIALKEGAFRQYQRDWLNFKESYCDERMKAGGGGTAALLIGDSCHINQLIRRTLWFEGIGR